MANNDILVMIDHTEGSLDSTAAEILTAANGLAKQSGGEVLAALCSSDSGSLPQKIISLGGGGFINESIRNEILLNHISFWLNWNNGTLFKRIKNSKKRKNSIYC